MMKRYFENLMIVSWFIGTMATLAFSLELMTDGTIPQQPHATTVGLIMAVFAFFSFVGWCTYLTRGA